MSWWEVASLGSDPTGGWQDYSSPVGVASRCVVSRLLPYASSFTVLP